MWESLMVNSGEWFLWTLFLVICLLLLTNAVERRVRPAVFWLFLAGLVFIALFTPEMEKDYLRQTEIRYFLPFALVGNLIAKHRQALARSGWQLVYAGAVCYPVMMWLPGWEGGWERTYQHSFYWCLENGMAGFFWTRFLQALSGICLVLVFARVLNRLEAPARLLAKLGGISLGVYLFHQIFSALAFGAGLVAALTGFASSLAIAVGLTIFCRKAGYLRIIVGDFRGVGKPRLMGELNVKPLA
jgi:peptidoglycan/LPS O-acetylase OafA/YrhL